MSLEAVRNCSLQVAEPAYVSAGMEEANQATTQIRDGQAVLRLTVVRHLYMQVLVCASVWFP